MWMSTLGPADPGMKMKQRRSAWARSACPPQRVQRVQRCCCCQAAATAAARGACSLGLRRQCEMRSKRARAARAAVCGCVAACCLAMLLLGQAVRGGRRGWAHAVGCASLHISAHAPPAEDTPPCCCTRAAAAAETAAFVLLVCVCVCAPPTGAGTLSHHAGVSTTCKRAVCGRVQMCSLAHVYCAYFY